MRGDGRVRARVTAYQKQPHVQAPVLAHQERGCGCDYYAVSLNFSHGYVTERLEADTSDGSPTRFPRTAAIGGRRRVDVRQDEQPGRERGRHALGSAADTLPPVAESPSQNTLLAQLDIGLVPALCCRSRSSEACTDQQRHRGDDQQAHQRLHLNLPGGARCEANSGSNRRQRVHNVEARRPLLRHSHHQIGSAPPALTIFIVNCELTRARPGSSASWFM